MFWGSFHFKTAGCRDKLLSFTLWGSTQCRLKIETSHHIHSLCTITIQVHCAGDHFKSCVSDGLFWFMKILKVHWTKFWISTFGWMSFSMKMRRLIHKDEKKNSNIPSEHEEIINAWSGDEVDLYSCWCITWLF